MPALSLVAVPGRRSATLDLAKEIEARGFTGIYCPSFGDGMGLCHSLATETNEIAFGTSITNIYTRHPADYAQSAAFMHETSGGRFRLGLGVSHEAMNDRMGINTGKPLTDMRNFVATITSQKRIGDLAPIILAGLRDKMCSLAGEIGGGVTFANVARSYVPTTLETLAGAQDLGADFEVWNMIPTTISDDRDAAAAVNRQTLRMYVGLPNYRNYWKQAGYQDEMEAIETAIDAGDHDAVPGLMTDQWLSDCTLFGTASEVREGVEAWFDAGVTAPILVPSSVSGGQMKAFAEIFELYS